MKSSQRFDFVFSYWIFLWYVLYILQLVKYNPKWALTIGLIENTFALALMFFYKNSFINIFLFCFINVFIKILPLWTLRNTKYQINGIYSLIILFCIYLLWLKINHFDIIKNTTEWFDYVKKDNDPGPFTYYTKRLFNL
jgi:hypothetical protein